MSDHILVIYSFILKLFMKVAANFYCIHFFFFVFAVCEYTRQAVGKSIYFFFYICIYCKLQDVYEKKIFRAFLFAFFLFLLKFLQ